MRINKDSLSGFKKKKKICYLNSLQKCYKKLCGYNVTLKRIDSIVKKGKV